MASLTTVKKKVVRKAAPKKKASWLDGLVEAAKKSSLINDGEFRGEVEGVAYLPDDYGYDDNSIAYSFSLILDMSDAREENPNDIWWRSSSTEKVHLFALNFTTFPSNCGILVAHELEDFLHPDIYQFYFESMLAYAFKNRYGMLVISDVKREATVKAALKFGFTEVDSCKNPNSGNTITLMYMRVTDPKIEPLTRAALDTSRN